MHLIFNEEKFRKIVGKEIKKIREEQKLTQDKLAILGLGYAPFDGTNGQQKICKIENARQGPSILDLYTIVKALGVKLEPFIERCLRQL